MHNDCNICGKKEIYEISGLEVIFKKAAGRL